MLFFSFSLSLPLFHSPAVLPLSALPAGCTPPSASERKKSTSSRNLSSYLLSITYPLRNLKISLASEKQYSLSIPRLGFERHAAESSHLPLCRSHPDPATSRRHRTGQGARSQGEIPAVPHEQLQGRQTRNLRSPSFGTTPATTLSSLRQQLPPPPPKSARPFDTQYRASDGMKDRGPRLHMAATSFFTSGPHSSSLLSANSSSTGSLIASAAAMTFDHQCMPPTPAKETTPLTASSPASKKVRLSAAAALAPAAEAAPVRSHQLPINPNDAQMGGCVDDKGIQTIPAADLAAESGLPQPSTAKTPGARSLSLAFPSILCAIWSTVTRSGKLAC